jgi:hypothetical protein
MTGNGHVRFGGRPPQKYRPGNRRQLGGGPPNYQHPKSTGEFANALVAMGHGMRVSTERNLDWDHTQVGFLGRCRAPTPVRPPETGKRGTPADFAPLPTGDFPAISPEDAAPWNVDDNARSCCPAQRAISAWRLTTSSTRSQRVSLLRCVNTNASTSAWTSACSGSHRDGE